ncbi:hypothetical protein [Butyrivibrio sp. AE2032]|uniref:hypothetical protein n=1 Tax=Butyrivibrio sp. AE2032 TaxID=1458463 RepID=UPI000556633D|nr:hypothetical protein [Butyrivibrio sp. AE2032]
MKKKSDIILIIITVILVIVLAVGFVYDRNTALIERTNHVAIVGDENLEIVKMNKVGFLFMRAAYEARLRIKDGEADNYIIRIAQTYGGAGEMFDYTQYKQYEADALNGVTIKPNPREDSFIWVLGVRLEENSNKNVVYIVTLEGEGEAYLYLYYSRR